MCKECNDSVTIYANIHKLTLSTREKVRESDSGYGLVMSASLKNV